MSHNYSKFSGLSQLTVLKSFDLFLNMSGLNAVQLIYTTDNRSHPKNYVIGHHVQIITGTQDILVVTPTGIC